MKTFADAEAALAKSLPGYTARKPQQELAAFVEGVIANEGHGLAEAGTGTGKSLATVIPAILSGRSVVVATATKALQDQYAKKDMPFLQKHLGVEFTWANLKGKSNYVCLANAFDGNRANRAPNGTAILAEIKDNIDHDGDFDNFDAPVTEQDRWALSTTAADCSGKQCPFYEDCFATNAKRKAAVADVVITNQMMLLTDLKLRERTAGGASMLGAIDLVMVDEGHEFEEWATKALEANIKERGITMLCSEAENFALANAQDIKEAQRVRQAQRHVWAVLPKADERMTLSWFVDRADVFMELIDSLRYLAIEVKNLHGEGKQFKAQQAKIITRCENEAQDLAEALTEDDDRLVRWIEVVEDRKTRETYKNIRTAPVHVGAYLNQWLWSETPAVLLSATLSINGNFNYIAERLGLPVQSTTSFTAGTPFDYTTQALLFVPPKDAPNPKNRAGWLGYSATMSRELVQAAGGGALLLYTSRSAMEQAYESLAPMFTELGYTCLMQGQYPNPVLAKMFTEDTHSVMFAMKSFMTGVDFQGDTCRLVIIDKLPFPVPTEPVFAARADQIKRRGGNDFSQLTIPAMSLTLKQAYGRLIRTVNDRGVVAILDSRLSSTGWGQGIVRSLPNSPKTTGLGDVQEFFS